MAGPFCPYYIKKSVVYSHNSYTEKPRQTVVEALNLKAPPTCYILRTGRLAGHADSAHVAGEGGRLGGVRHGGGAYHVPMFKHIVNFFNKKDTKCVRSQVLGISDLTVHCVGSQYFYFFSNLPT
jgi:hypothetical protein